jgi:hypothetical protein
MLDNPSTLVRIIFNKCGNQPNHTRNNPMSETYDRISKIAEEHQQSVLNDHEGTVGDELAFTHGTLSVIMNDHIPYLIEALNDKNQKDVEEFIGTILGECRVMMKMMNTALGELR